MSYHIFAANFLNGELRKLPARQVRQREQRLAIDDGPAVYPDQILDAQSEDDPNEQLALANAPHDDVCNAVLRTKLTPLRLYKRQYLREQQMMGRKVNPATTSTWAEVKSAYERLSPAQKTMLDNQSDATKSVAAQNRRMLKEKQRQEQLQHGQLENSRS
eukprot:5134531-Karenia_brevis.AAC.1